MARSREEGENMQGMPVKKLKMSATGCIQCPAWDHLWRPSVEEVSQRDGFNKGQSLTKQAAFVLATACTNLTLLNYIYQFNVVHVPDLASI